MAKKTNYIDWNELSPLMDEIYNLIELEGSANSQMIEEYLFNNTNLTKAAIHKLTTQFIKFQEEEREEIGEYPRSILFRKVFTFEDFQHWDSELYSSAIEFRNLFTLYPDILIMNIYTTKKIDLIANNMQRGRIRNSENEEISDPEEFAVLSSFDTDEFSLEFAVDEAVPNDKYILVFDSGPNWDGGEEVKQDDTPFELDDLIHDEDDLPENIQERKTA